MSSSPALAAGHNARWLAVSQALRVGVQLAALLVLSRLLAPADFGLMAIVLAVTNFAMLWRDLGTATAIVRAAELRDDMVSSVFWLNVGVGLAIGMLLVLARAPIAHLMGDDRLQPLLLLVALSFPIQGAAAAQQALLERAGRFRALAAIDLASGVLGLGAAIGGALAGWGAASLALQAVVTVASSAPLLWLVSGWRPRWQARADELRRLLHFSAHLTAFNFINYFTRNADSVIIGRLLGPIALGPYSLAMRVTLFPVQNLTWAASRALLPVMSRVEQGSQELAALYLRSVSVIALFSAPLMAGLFALRDDFVAVVLGAQWTTVVDLLGWLAPVGFVQSIVSTVGPVFLASGRSDTLMRLGLLSLVLIVGGILVGAQFDIVTVAACYFAANLLHAGPCLLAATRQLDIPLMSLCRRLAAPLASALVMALAIIALQQLGPWQSTPAAVRLGISIVTGAALYIALAWRLDRAALLDALRIARLRKG